MFRRILVPVDGSPLADQILAPVRRLLLREDAELMLLRVIPPKPGSDRLKLWEEVCDRALQHLEVLAAKWTRDGARVKTDTRPGEPAAEVLKFADAWLPSLIAMSTHGRTGIDRWVRGSVAERVLERSPYPVLVANPRALERTAPSGAPEFRRILVPVDGSETSARILPRAIEIARLFEADITLFYCALFLPSPAHLEVAREFTAEEALPVLEPYRARVEKAGIPVRLTTAMGYPPEEILAACEREKVDLVAMTTHGRSGLSRFLYGSVAEKVLRLCRVPLLIERSTGQPG